MATYRVGNGKPGQLLGGHAALDEEPLLCLGAEVLLDKVGEALILDP